MKLCLANPYSTACMIWQDYERMNVADALFRTEYTDGELIIQQVLYLNKIVFLESSCQ